MIIPQWPGDECHATGNAVMPKKIRRREYLRLKFPTVSCGGVGVISAPKNGDHQIKVVTERFDRFAEQCDIWADRLERTRGNTVDAAHFAPPSADPASVRTTERLAINGQELDGTPVACITKAVSALRAQAQRVRVIARIYREADQGNADRLRKKGDPAL